MNIGLTLYGNYIRTITSQASHVIGLIESRAGRVSIRCFKLAAEGLPVPVQ